jgi:hypothetical protein
VRHSRVVNLASLAMSDAGVDRVVRWVGDGQGGER